MSNSENKNNNTLTNRKEIFEPIQAGNVSIYACGVTVYDLCHRTCNTKQSFMTLLLDTCDIEIFQVNYVRNYTDVDDKIIDRANEKGYKPSGTVKRNDQSL